MTTYNELNEAQREHLIDMVYKTGYTRDALLWAMDIISDRLDDMEGYKLYVADLAYELTDREQADGYVDNPSTVAAQDWISKHFDDCAVAYEEMKCNYVSNSTNPFEDPTGFQLYVYIEMVKAIVNQWEWTEEHYDEEVTLTPETIAILKRELWGDDDDQND